MVPKDIAAAVMVVEAVIAITKPTKHCVEIGTICCRQPKPGKFYEKVSAVYFWNGWTKKRNAVVEWCCRILCFFEKMTFTTLCFCEIYQQNLKKVAA